MGVLSHTVSGLKLEIDSFLLGRIQGVSTGEKESAHTFPGGFATRSSNCRANRHEVGGACRSTTAFPIVTLSIEVFYCRFNLEVYFVFH